MKRVISSLLFFSCFTVIAFAQAAPSAGAGRQPAPAPQEPPAVVAAPGPAASVPGTPAVELKIFGLEAGMTAGYDLAAGELAGGTAFALAFILGDNLSAAFQASTITPSGGTAIPYGFLRFSYHLNSLLGFSIYTGGNGADPAAGLGIFLNILRSTPPVGISSAYRLRLEYLFPIEDVAGGTVALSAVMSLGI